VNAANADRLVWVFNPAGAKSPFPTAVFTSKQLAESWINRHNASGTITAYPLDECHYDWAIRNGHFQPKRDDQRTSEFITRFSTGTMHHHYNMTGPEGHA
jgi:hypothetical protein